MQKILLIEYHRNLSTGFIIEPIKNSNFEIAVFILHNFGYVSRDRVGCDGSRRQSK